jgi:hypothetical protein
MECARDRQVAAIDLIGYVVHELLLGVVETQTP